jgi:hypothetical protein
VPGGSSGTATITPITPQTTYVANHSVAAGDMAGIMFMTGSWTLTIPAISSTVFPAKSWSCYSNIGSGTVTISTTPTINGMTGTTIPPGGSGCWSSNGTSLDYVAGVQPASSTVIGGVKSPTYSMSIGWIATVNPLNTTIGVLPAAATITSIVGAVETATGGAATVSVNKAPSATACSAGTTLHSGSFNANGTAATNQTLTVTTTALASGDRLCLQTTGTTSWTGGTGIGGITVNYTIP